MPASSYRPAPVDYLDDAHFWHNLPANFDVLDACYRMYLWTGDKSYLTDPVFLNSTGGRFTSMWIGGSLRPTAS